MAVRLGRWCGKGVHHALPSKKTHLKGIDFPTSSRVILWTEFTCLREERNKSSHGNTSPLRTFLHLRLVQSGLKADPNELLALLLTSGSAHHSPHLNTFDLASVLEPILIYKVELN